MPNRTRFAPSPTGRLHLGHAYAAAQVFAFAAQQGGEALLRIEDIDHTRCKPEFVDGIYEDLRWLGHDWPEPVRVQSEHIADYANVVMELVTRGLAYPCTLTRTELKAGNTPYPTRKIANIGETNSYDSDYSLNISGSSSDQDLVSVLEAISSASTQDLPTLPFAIRLDLKTCLKILSDYSLRYAGYVRSGRGKQDQMRVEASSQALDARPALAAWAKSDRPDPIIARRDIAASYHIAVTHDDALQGVTHVVRGADFVDQTPLHVLIQRLMDWPTPIYQHHALVTDATGRKLSKSARDLTIRALRESGLSPEDVLSRAAQGL